MTIAQGPKVNAWKLCQMTNGDHLMIFGERAGTKMFGTTHAAATTENLQQLQRYLQAQLQNLGKVVLRNLSSIPAGSTEPVSISIQLGPQSAAAYLSYLTKYLNDVEAGYASRCEDDPGEQLPISFS